MMFQTFRKCVFSLNQLKKAPTSTNYLDTNEEQANIRTFEKKKYKKHVLEYSQVKGISCRFSPFKSTMP